jgi:hypothetical protein
VPGERKAVRRKGRNCAMLRLRSSTYRRPSTLSQQELCADEAVSPVQSQMDADWLPAFVRAAVQTTSPSAVRKFLRELDANDPLLSRLGWALMLVIPVFAAFALSATGAVHGVNPWIKPIKFSLSFSNFAFTVSLMLMALQIPQWQLRAARTVIATTISLEILSLGMQAWRSAYPHSAHSLPAGLLSFTTNNMVMAITAVACWMLVLFCANRVRNEMVDGPMVSAICYSFVIFLLGNAVGGYMLARGSHTVGAVDGTPGLPFVNWSIIAGDLRIAHFIAIHAIQILPLFAYILAQMAPIPALKQRRVAVAALAMIVGGAVGATFLQAAMGRPLVPWLH